MTQARSPLQHYFMNDILVQPPARRRRGITFSGQVPSFSRRYGSNSTFSPLNALLLSISFPGTMKNYLIMRQLYLDIQGKIPYGPRLKKKFLSHHTILPAIDFIRQFAMKSEIVSQFEDYENVSFLSCLPSRLLCLDVKQRQCNYGTRSQGNNHRSPRQWLGIQRKVLP